MYYEKATKTKTSRNHGRYLLLKGEQEMVIITGHDKKRGLVRVVPFDLDVQFQEVWWYGDLKEIENWTDPEDRSLFLNRFYDYDVPIYETIAETEND